MTGTGGLNYVRTGSGEPLVLIHGTGSWLGTWEPVLGLLAAERDVIAIDLPGHGDSPLLGTGVPPTPVGYAAAVARLLDDLGLEDAHAAGNSAGGWTALELAKLGRARSVVALGPAGLWGERNPAFARLSLRFMRRAPAPPALLRSPAGRTVALARTFGRPWRVPGPTAIEIARRFKSARGFDEHLRATSGTRFTGGKTISVPVTIAWGEREHLIAKRARRGDELPDHTRWIELPGCGHVPMWDDPPLVARTILDGTAPVASTARESASTAN